MLLTGAAGGLVSIADATLIEPGWLQVKRRDIRMPGWPPVLDGLRIALISDLHYDQPDRDDGFLAGLVKRLNGERPDLVLMPGDFIDSKSQLFPALAAILGGIRAKHGVFASMGNHDGWNADHALVRREMEKNGISMMINRWARVDISGQSLAVAGTDHVWLGRPDPVAAFQGIPGDAPVVAMIHEPDFFDVAAGVRPGILQVSGHTHGGQCRVPFAGFAPVLPKFGRKYASGLYAAGNSRLFVTDGVGTTGLRVRFACPPEIALLTVRC